MKTASLNHVVTLFILNAATFTAAKGPLDATELMTSLNHLNKPLYRHALYPQQLISVCLWSFLLASPICNKPPNKLVFTVSIMWIFHRLCLQ